MFVLIWPFASGRWKGPLGRQGDVEAAPEFDHPTAASTTAVTLPPPTITIAAGGRFGSEVLESLEFAFWEESGEPVDVVPLSSDFEVWKQATQSNRVDADVIEVAFRTDAFTGEAAEAFLPLTEELVPALAGIPSEFRLPEDRGVVVGLSGLVGFVVDSRSATAAPGSWSEVAGVAPDRLVLPAPSSVMAPIVVLAAGNGDIDAGVELYASWLDGGALTASNTEEYVAALRDGAEAAVWTSGGFWRAEGRMEGLEFVAPVEGAVALPAFSGVLASSDHPEVAARWIDYRLSDSVQRQAASTYEHGRFGQSDLAPLSPILPGLDEGGLSRAHFDLGSFPGSIVGVDWSRYPDARRALDERFPPGAG